MRLSAAVWRGARGLARRPLLCGLLLFAAVAAVRCLLLPRLPVPVPGIHDEFSYLLMGDTFAHGRLSNPPHAMWMSFETFHVNWFPRYASMYPPAQGAVLALGEILGNPWLGVVLSCAALCCAVYWMLLAWMPSRWALVGGAVAWLKFGVTSYWINSYWGGAAAATGGALLAGSVARLLRRARTRDALLCGLGLAILANSRPYEGLLFSLPAAVVMLRWLFTGTHIAAAAKWRRAALPLACVLAATLLCMGYYNRQLTGHALLFPHTMNVRNYHTAPMMLFEHAKPERRYNNQQFEDFYNGWERDEYDHTWASVWCLTWLKTVRFFSAYAWWGMLLAAPGAWLALRDRRLLWLIAAALLVASGSYLVVWSNAHYAAPATCVVIVLYVQALRHLRALGSGARRWGAILARTSLLLLLVDTAGAAIRKDCDTFSWTCQGDISRLVVQRKLEALPGKHLVMVRYGEDHNIHDDWVQNGAEIDGAKVVWARELGTDQDAKLLEYFKDRTVWLVTPDDDNTYLERYTPPAQ